MIGGARGLMLDIQRWVKQQERKAQVSRPALILTGGLSRAQEKAIKRRRMRNKMAYKSRRINRLRGV